MLLLQDPGPPGLFQPRKTSSALIEQKKIWLLSAIRQNHTFTWLLWTSSHRNFIKGLCSLTFLILPGCLWYTIYHYITFIETNGKISSQFWNIVAMFFLFFLFWEINVPRNISIPANIINQRGHSFLKTQTKYTFSSPNSKEFLA